MGRKTKVTKNGDHLRMNVIGMVCSHIGQFFAVETSHSEAETFEDFLNQARKFVTFDYPKNIMVVDNTSWHRKKTLKLHAFQPLFLSSYSPDLNPIEHIWLTIKAQWFNNYVCRNVDQLIDRLDQAILDVTNNPNQNQKIAAIGI